MIKNQKISLVMPCKNEAKSLQAVLSKLPKQIDEVIVVDNNSNDKTKEVAAKFGAAVINEVRNDRFGIGYGFALQKGINQASGDIVICMDGDDSYPILEVPRIVKEFIKNKIDFISCNRLPFKDPKKMSIVRASGVRILNLITWVLYGYRIKDSLTGMWVFKNNIYKRLSPKEGGWDFSLEIKLRAINNEEVIFAEHHIPYRDRVLDLSKQSLFQTGFHHALYLFKFKFNSLSKNLVFKPSFGLNADK
jgi:glycosyltransferase involved in cell wall biosynthesis